MGLHRRLVLFGPPGSGKGTQAELLRDREGLDHISPGDMLRQHQAAGSELGRMASAYMDRGELVPDDVIVDMIKQRLQGEADGIGFVLDGFPRTVPQASSLGGMLEQLGQAVDAVVVLDVPEQVLTLRLARRAAREHRHDDSPEVIKQRLRVYWDQTEPVLGYLGERLPARHVDGSPPVEEVYAQLLEALA